LRASCSSARVDGRLYSVFEHVLLVQLAQKAQKGENSLFNFMVAGGGFPFFFSPSFFSLSLFFVLFSCKLAVFFILAKLYGRECESAKYALNDGSLQSPRRGARR